ncbi:MAG: MraY family glycosyltransferase [Patescibacteria group bacterium]
MIYILPFLISVITTKILIFVLLKFGFYKKPGERGNERDIHFYRAKKIITRGGGFAIFLGFLPVLFFLENINKGVIFFFLGLVFLMVVGLIDDKFELSGKLQFLAFFISSLFLVVGGFGMDFIRNPFGDLINLKIWEFKILEIGGTSYFATFPADLLTIFWVFVLINAINFADGIDSLISFVGIVASVILLVVAERFGQTDNVEMIKFFIFANLGFLVFHFPPAKIMHGSAGSYFLGFFLAGISLFSGGKVATAMIVLGIPIVDAFYVSISRIFRGKFPWTAGHDHMHHKFLDLGFSHLQISLIYSVITLLFGLITLFGETKQKFFGVLVMIIFCVGLNLFLDFRLQKK